MENLLMPVRKLHYLSEKSYRYLLHRITNNIDPFRHAWPVRNTRRARKILRAVKETA